MTMRQLLTPPQSEGELVTQIGDRALRHPILIPGSQTELVLSWGSATDVGHKRRHNEDSFLAESPIFVVADGLGGHTAGDVASAAVVTRLAEVARSQEFTEAAVVDEALRAAAADIELVADETELGVGTTVAGAALTLQDGQPYWAVFNIGDSRVYLFERSELNQITVDHSVVQGMVDAGLIRAEDAEFHPDSNVITRAVGFESLPAPDYWLIPVRTGMRLLLCSDGLTRELGPRLLGRHLGAGQSAQDTADTLLQEALAAGGRDNITVIVVDVLESPIPAQEQQADSGQATQQL